MPMEDLDNFKQMAGLEIDEVVLYKECNFIPNVQDRDKRKDVKARTIKWQSYYSFLKRIL